jgi:hypothetical protein
MKRSSLTENNFEVTHVAKTLINNGYVERLPDNYNQELFLDTEAILNFLKDAQLAEWKKLQEKYPSDTENIYLKYKDYNCV